MFGFSAEETVRHAREFLREELRRRGGPFPVIQMPVMRAHVRAVVDALRADGRDVLTTDAEVERWTGDAPGAPEVEYYPVVTVRPRLMRHSNGNEWWE